MQHFRHCGVERSKLTYHDSVTAALRMAVELELCTVHNEIQSHSLYGLDVVTQLSGNGPVCLGVPYMSFASSLRMATDFNLKALLPEVSALY